MISVPIPLPVVSAVEMHTGAKISAFSPAAGGCINDGGRITTSAGVYFLKWNASGKYPGMFEAEAKGLSLLRDAAELEVPVVVHYGNAEDYQFLLLEYVATGERSPSYWEDFGRGLAAMHKHTASMCGLDHDNYIGSLPQNNRQTSSWVEFFIHQRLEPQLRLALSSKALDETASGTFARLFNKLPSLLPAELPSLLHGDLWSGNIMTTASGRPCLIDPAVYYGHREVDLAMTQLFGGFDAIFLESYEDVYPLLPGYEERLELYNLYPLLVHVNLFGGGYARQVMSVLNSFV